MLFYVIFALSGFCGLIYESIWSRYLGLFLGHAAYAQTLVLVIFMGGLALGSWLCSRWSVRWRNLLRSYALAEGVIGLFALLFHETFTALEPFFFNVVTPRITAPAAGMALKWGSAALLILPQSILLGMTFPLMSGGIIRRHPDRPGRTLATLYFCNSIGGVAGVLASGFLLLGRLGLPGTIRTAGAINVVLALVVWFLARSPESAFAAVVKPEADNGDRRGSGIFLLVSLLTGMASFIYEISWIRMLSMVLGSSTHSFEIMLSAFILGLALGGFWIRSRIDQIKDPMAFLGLVQLVMGILALSTLVVYGSTFNVMQWLLKVLPQTSRGYVAFHLASHGISMAVMLPTTFCAGMTLPLITYVLIAKSFGEKSIGAVYSANTVGAIAGIIFAVHYGMPVLGLRNLMVSGAATDIAVGVLLLLMLPRSSGKRLPLAASVAGLAAIAATIAWVQLDPYQMASGVFRRSQARLDSSAGDIVLFHADGKTATIDVVWQSTFLSVRTNGKSDAAVNWGARGEASLDEATMVLLGALPMLLHREAKLAANIGMGSGLTSELLLTAPTLSQVDTVEIEQTMVEAAKHFRPRNELVFTDPRSHIYIEDAKTFFATQRKKYDIIVSEPSNPWVSGVAGLFSHEFYGLVTRHLNPGGILVQWLQLYEIDLALVASVLKALSPQFTDYQVYVANQGDILIVARHGESIPRPEGRLLEENPRYAAALRRVGIASAQDIEIRRIGNKRLLDPWLNFLSVSANSDYYPKLDLGAERTRFLGLNAGQLLMLRQASLPIMEILEGSGGSDSSTTITPTSKLGFTQRAFAATAFRDQVLGRSVPALPPAASRIEQEVRKVLDACRSGQRVIAPTPNVFKVGLDVVPNLQPAELDHFWRRFGTLPCAAGLREEDAMWLELYKALGMRDAPAMSRVAAALLKRGAQAEYVPYLLAVAMLADRAQGNDARAYSIWTQYRGGNFHAGWAFLLDVIGAGAAPQRGH
jgi:predicted membrane-bound spermidine synthase